MDNYIIRMNFFCLFLLAVVFSISYGREVGIRDYTGYQVYTITATSASHNEVLQKLLRESSNGEMDFWTRPKVNRKTDVMVAPEAQLALRTVLESNNIPFQVKVVDVQQLINSEKIQNNQLLQRSLQSQQACLNCYMRYSEIEAFLQTTAANHKDLVTLSVIGQSYEKRNIYSVKISNSQTNQKAILIDANIHAREWITSATAIWIINEILTTNSTILNGIDWYIIPMVNPDGYEYTHTTDRTWRKTRSINSGSTCRGCDPNRNFPFQFGGEGTSSNPCSNIFKGPTPLSESESRVLATYMQTLKNNTKVSLEAYISFHSYGQLWLLPWGYTAGAHPDDFEDQKSLGNNVVSAIYGVNGTLYQNGAGADVLYGVGGASDDYAKAIGIKYSVTAEMRDEGNFGFLLPPDQIEINAREIFAGLREVALRVNPRT